MPKEMVISATPHETRVAILEDGQLCEIYVERQREFALVGSIYKGKVNRVLPGMQSSFVEIGLDSDAFLYVSDFLEGIEEFDQIVTTVEDKVHKMEEQGGQVFAPEIAPGAPIEPPDVEGELPVATLPQASVPASRIEPRPFRDDARRGDRPDRGRRDDSRGHGRRGRRGRGSPRRGELPSAKYAHHRPQELRHPEGHTDEPPTENLDVVILPGESLARFNKPAEEPAKQAGESSGAPFDPAAEHPAPSAAAAENPVVTPFAQRREQAAPRPRFEPREQRQRPEKRPLPGWGVIEALPGESLAGLKNLDHAAASEEYPAPLPESAKGGEAISETPTPAPFPVSSGLSHREMDSFAESALDRQTAASNEVVPSPEFHAGASASGELAEATHAETELSADEAAALTESVAEAQEEAQDAEHSLHLEDEGEHGHETEDATSESGDGDMDAGSHHELHAEHDGESSAMEDFRVPLASMDATGEMESAEASVEAGEFEFEQQHASTEEDAAAHAESQPSQARIRSDFRARMNQPARRGRREDRGRRDHAPQHSSHRQTPRRPQLISEMLKTGQEIIVQIAKEPLGKKGARITSHIALPGRFLVYMPTLDHTGISRKIASAQDRSRLRTLVNEAKGAAGGGFIVRTAAEHASSEDVRDDALFLTRTWMDIKTRAEQRRAPALLHRDLNLVERILRDHLSPDFGAIWLDSEEEFAKVLEFVSRFQPQLANRVKLYSKETPIFEEFGIQQEVDKALKPKVWLKSGGSIVINHTEALVAIDVNTGKFVGKGSTRLEDTIVKTNLEAVKEIVRQIRLRDLGGIIVIDFIDMEERRNREKVMAALEEALRADRAPSKVLRFNEFGLVAITRKRTKQALERTLCQPCPYCTGSGMVKSIATLCYEIQAEARKMAPDLDSGSVTLRVHPEVSKALKTRESSLIEELEQWTKKNVIIQADPTLHWEQYDIY
jgi:Rne/Rng family ribonuclease